MKILFIGGTGYLSSVVLRKSIEKGFKNYILTRGNKLPIDGVEAIKVDIKDVDTVNRLLEKQQFDIVIDFIAYNRQQLSEHFSIFLNKCKQYIFISSVAVYKPGSKVLVEDKSPLINEDRQYSINKVDAERFLMQNAANLGIKYTIVRPAITYGDISLPYGIPYGSFPKHGNHRVIIERILNEKPILLTQEGANSSQSFTYVDEFAVGCIGLFGNEHAYNQAFHIVDNRFHSWETVVKTIAEVLQKKPIIVKVPIDFLSLEMGKFRKEEIYGMMNTSKDPSYDLFKINKAVPEYKNVISLKDGITKVIKKYRDNENLKSIDYEFDAQCDRIIKRYYKKNKNELLRLNNRYIDYLNERSFLNKTKYYINFHLNLRYIKLFLSIMGRIIRKLSRTSIK